MGLILRALAGLAILLALATPARADGRLSPQGGTITAVAGATGGGLTGGGTGGPVYLGLLTTCSSTQVLAWNGSAWACAANGTGDITAVIAGNGLLGGATSGDATVTINPATATTINNAIHLAAWGDSITQTSVPFAAGQDWPTQFGVLTGYRTFNGGISGETSTQIKTRMLADTAKLAWPVIIWAGRNNYTSSATVQADIAAMVAGLGHTNYLVLSILNANASNEWNTGADYPTIIALNNALAATYGSHYLDIRAYLVSQYNPGIPQDVIDHGHDVYPTSLHSDPLHPSAAGDTAIAVYLAAHLANLLQGADRVVTENDLLSTSNLLWPITGLTAGTIPVATSPTTIGNSTITDISGVTTIPNVLSRPTSALTATTILQVPSTNYPSTDLFALNTNEIHQTSPSTFNQKQYLLGYNWTRPNTGEPAIWSQWDSKAWNGSAFENRYAVYAVGTDAITRARLGLTTLSDGSAGTASILGTTTTIQDWGGNTLAQFSAAGASIRVPTQVVSDSTTSALSVTTATGNVQVMRVGSASQETDVTAYVVTASPQMYLWNPSGSGGVEEILYANNGAKVGHIQEGSDGSMVFRNSATGGSTYFDIASGGLNIRNSSFANTVTVSDAGNVDAPLGRISGTSVRTNGSTGPKWTGGTGAPAASCAIGDEFSRTDGAAGTVLYTCTATNTWAAMGGGSGTVTGTGTANTTTKWTGTSAIGNAWALDDGTTWGVSSKFTITEATGAFVASSTGSIGGALNMNSHLINNVTDPSSAQDAATKAYVDAHAGSTISGLTTNKLVKATSSTTIGNANTSDDGSSFIVGPSAFTVNESTGATVVGGQISIAGVSFTNGTVYAQNSTQAISFDTNTNAAATANIDTTGYSGGTTQARSVIFFDGQGSTSGHQILKLDGTNTNVSIPNGSLSVKTTGLVQGVLTAGTGADSVGAASTELYVTNAGTTCSEVRDSTNHVESENCASSSGGFVGTYTNHTFHIQTNNVNAIQIDTSQATTILGTLTANSGVTVTGNETLSGRFVYSDALMDQGTLFTLVSGTAQNLKGATSGTFTASGTTETITFGITFTVTPTCVISTDGTAKGYSYTRSTTQLTFASLTNGQKYDFDCIGH